MVFKTKPCVKDKKGYTPVAISAGSRSDTASAKYGLRQSDYVASHRARKLAVIYIAGFVQGGLSQLNKVSSIKFSEECLTQKM